MDQPTFSDLCDFLQGLQPLRNPRDLKGLVLKALFDHPVIGQVQWDGAAAQVIPELVRACLDFDQPTGDGSSPLCAVLAAIRAEGFADGALKAEFHGLRGRLGCAETPVVDWHYDPYPGMLALNHTQAPIFFGRVAETRDLIDRLQTPAGARLLVVAGASGSGKSSLVRAGLWGTLADPKRTPIAGSSAWVISAIKPSEPTRDPLENLVWGLRETGIPGIAADPRREAAGLRADPAALVALGRRVLAGKPAGARWLLIVDQFEEVFTSVKEADRAAFLGCLLAALEHGGPGLVLTVRSDFLDQCFARPGLRAAFNTGAHYGVGAPGPAAMTEMIEGPVRRLTLAYPVCLDDALTNRLVSDAAASPGGLALLAFALKDLYTSCSAKPDRVMGVADYEDKAFGGLSGVIERRACEAVAGAGVDLGAVLPRVFARLLTLRPDGAATRRREDLAHWAEDPEARRLIQALAAPEARLLVIARRGEEGLAPGANLPQGCVLEVAHEAVFSAWKDLRLWIELRREALMLRPRVEQDTARWADAGRPDDRLPKPAIVTEWRDLLEAAGLWGELTKDAPTAAYFLVRDEAMELLALVRQAHAATSGADSAPGASGDLDGRTALLHTLTGEGRRASTLAEMGERLSAADPEASRWLRAGLGEVLNQLADPVQAPRWHTRRLRLGDLLAALGDDRQGVGLRCDGLPDIAWQAVPAGPFEWPAGETRQARETGAYRMSRYPLTHCQYQVFIEAKDYADPRWWQEGYQAPVPASPLWDQPNRPRVDIAWVEALAYCRWLTVHLQAAGLIAAQEVIRLPTEYEWVKAAGGTDGREYPWGAGYRSGDANVNEIYNRIGRLNLQETAAVGLYPGNRSPYGLMDCAGNCWEWCLNKYADPEDCDTAGEALRALHGGSWFFDARFARVASRLSHHVFFRVYAVGARLLCCVPRDSER